MSLKSAGGAVQNETALRIRELQVLKFVYLRKTGVGDSGGRHVGPKDIQQVLDTQD